MIVDDALQPEWEKLVPQGSDILTYCRIEVVVVDCVVVAQRGLNVLMDINNIVVDVGVVHVAKGSEAGP